MKEERNLLLMFCTLDKKGFILQSTLGVILVGYGSFEFKYKI